MDELAKSRLLIDTLAAENDALKTRLDTERQLTAVLTELDTARRAEADALRGTVKSKDEALNAKDAVIAADDKLIAALKAKKPSAWRRLADILIGAGIVAIAK